MYMSVFRYLEEYIQELFISRQGRRVKYHEAIKTYFHYINTNEIPGELSRENMISSHVIFRCEKITVAMAT